MKYNKEAWNNKEYLSKIIAESETVIEVIRKMGSTAGAGNYKTFYKYCKKFEINTSHFDKFSHLKHGKPFINLDDIFSNKVKFNNSSNLKEKLYKVGLKERKCEECGQDENWRGKKMSLILDHINGNNKDNRLENLRILCPYCDAISDTFKGKNRKK